MQICWKSGLAWKETIWTGSRKLLTYWLSWKIVPQLAHNASFYKPIKQIQCQWTIFLMNYFSKTQAIYLKQYCNGQFHFLTEDQPIPLCPPWQWKATHSQSILTPGHSSCLWWAKMALIIVSVTAMDIRHFPPLKRGGQGDLVVVGSL